MGAIGGKRRIELGRLKVRRKRSRRTVNALRGTRSASFRTLPYPANLGTFNKNSQVWQVLCIRKHLVGNEQGEAGEMTDNFCVPSVAVRCSEEKCSRNLQQTGGFDN